MFHTALIPWLDPNVIIHSVGPWSLLVVCGIIFAETGLLVGFVLPGDTLLVISGILTFTNMVFGLPIWWVCLLIALAAFLGGEAGYFIGHKAGPAIFERKETGLFSIENVKRTNSFFERFGALAVIIARFVPVVRTFAPVAAGVGHMSYRRYTAYNAIGAFLWGAGLTFFGWLLGFIPPVAHFVEKYIDLILILAVLVTVVPALVHYLLGLRKSRRLAKAEAADVRDADAKDGAKDRDARDPGAHRAETSNTTVPHTGASNAGVPSTGAPSGGLSSAERPLTGDQETFRSPKHSATSAD